MKTKQPTPDIFTTDTLQRFPLLHAFVSIWDQCRPAFAQERTHKLGLVLGLGLLTAFGRRTISRGICARALQALDWSKFYRFFSRDIWFPILLTHQILGNLDRHLEPRAPLVIGVDDTTADKTGTKVPGTAFFYNSKSPPFARSFKWALRFISISALVPVQGLFGPAKGILLKLKLAPTVIKPKKNASEQEQKQYKLITKNWSITSQMVEQLYLLRAQMDAITQLAKRLLVIVADATYTNKTVIRALPLNCILIGRTRKDIKLFELAQPKPGKGRPKRYGKALATPDEIRKDDTIPYQRCRVFAAGKHHDIRYKTLAPILWQSTGCQATLRLIIIAPLGYRLTKRSKMLYRSPAYLLVTDPDYPVELAIQHYLHRWEIEVNHREAKQNFGVGDAQVRHHRSVSRQFNFAALMYSLLLLAGLDSYGHSRTSNYIPLPKWRRDKRSRPSALDLATQLRIEMWTHEAGGQLTEFWADPVLAPNTPEYVQAAQAWLAQTVPRGLPISAWSAILHADA